MTVFSKLLLGKMHIRSYDLVDPISTKKNSDGSQLRLAKLKADSVFTAPCNTSVLYPTTGGNIHAFTAITPCAVLDVLGPPYSKQDGRDCSYYRDHPFAAYPNATVTQEEGHYYGWLEEIEVPPNSEMDGIENATNLMNPKDNRLPQTSMASMAGWQHRQHAFAPLSTVGGNDLWTCDNLRARVQGSKVFLVGKSLTACDYKQTCSWILGGYN
ncbi:hypothetical protein ACLB2K_065812 [Fragaria x ananassa]